MLSSSSKAIPMVSTRTAAFLILGCGAALLPAALAWATPKSSIHKDSITKALGESVYSLRVSPTRPWVKSVVSAILTAPLMLPLGLLWGIAMATPLKPTLLSMLIPRIMDTTAKEFQAERQELLKDVRGKVLDLGSGAGAYLKHCQNADQVVAVEPVEVLHDSIRKRGQNIKKLRIVSWLDDLMDAEDPRSFDWVILGNVLCEVTDLETTLHQIDVLLKPGGKVYFSEHIGRPKGTWQRLIQDRVNPLWRHMGGGCNCNRDSLVAIQERRSWDTVSWTYNHIQVCMGPFVMGLAEKRK